MQIVDIARILRRWPQNRTPTNAVVARYIEVGAPQHGLALISLTASLPCCITTSDRICGRGATIAGVTPNTSGTWTLIPICATCVEALTVLSEAATESWW